MPTFVLFLLGCCVLSVRGFLPSKESTDGRPDYTHASITQAAIYHATSDVIANVISPGKYNASDPDTTITTYFDHDALIHFAQTVMDIVNKNNLAQRTYRDDASRTMNCEQIEPGHLLLQTLRDKIIHQSQTANPNWDAVRDLIGQYLFTLQEFYSNTNWVEMFGDRVCQELGISGESLPYKVSDHDKVTCTSCNYTKEAVQQYSCVDNMRSDGQLLTSGYTSYQNINKPIGQFPPNMGKCSHGGPYDNSKDIPATGGINKETSSPELSPHFDLHQSAGEAAIQATYDFFVGNGTGLLSVLGIEKFKEVMGMSYKNPCYNCLAPGLSVVFVIDDTGSMSGEIMQATQHSIDIVNQAKLLGSNGPSNFILSTFNDPDTSIYNTTDGNEMKKWLHNMTAHGGGDCPEMALTGIVNALKIANPGSCVFFFTDADAKDPEKQNEVISLINDKHIKLVSFLRGDCGGGSRRRRSEFTVQNPTCILNDNSRRAGRARRSSAGFDLFSKIASATGGQIVHTSSSSLGGILGSFVKNNMGASKLGVTSFEMSAPTHSISVDSDLSILTVTIEGLSSAIYVSLDRPDGSTQMFSGTASIDKIGSTTVISVQHPPAGVWYLQKSQTRTWRVKVGGSGNIDFTYKFMEDVHGYKFPITGTSPITGSKLLISISVTGLSPTARVTNIILKKPNGVILTKLPVSDTSSGSNRVLYAYYDVTPEEFFVSINGSIGTNIFNREKSDIITPVTGEITFTSKPENLVLGENSVIDVAVKNTGSASQTYQLTATSVPSGFPTQRSHSVTVGPRSSKEISLTLTPTNVSVATLSVKLRLGGQTLQTISRTLMVVDVPPPKFNEVNRTSNCRQEMLNYYNCKKQNWTIVLDVAFRASLSQLYVTSTNVQLKYARNSPSVYVATLSGTCCTYQSQLTAIDARGNMKTKTIDFLGGNVFNTTVENFDILTKPIPVKTDKKHESLVHYIKVLTLAGAGTMVLVLVVAIVIASVYIKHKERNSTKNKHEKTPITVSLASLNQIRKNRRIVSALDF